MITQSGLKYWQVGAKRTALVKITENIWFPRAAWEPNKKRAAFRDAARPK